MRNIKEKAHRPSMRLSKNPGVDKGPQPLMALFGFGDMRGKSAKALAQQGFPCMRCWPRRRRKHRLRKLKKVAFSHFFDTLRPGHSPGLEQLNG